MNQVWVGLTDGRRHIRRTEYTIECCRAGRWVIGYLKGPALLQLCFVAANGLGLTLCVYIADGDTRQVIAGICLTDDGHDFVVEVIAPAHGLLGVTGCHGRELTTGCRLETFEVAEDLAAGIAEAGIFSAVGLFHHDGHTVVPVVAHGASGISYHGGNTVLSGDIHLGTFGHRHADTTVDETDVTVVVVANQSAHKGLSAHVGTVIMAVGDGVTPGGTRNGSDIPARGCHRATGVDADVRHVAVQVAEESYPVRSGYVEVLDGHAVAVEVAGEGMAFAADWLEVIHALEVKHGIFRDNLKPGFAGKGCPGICPDTQVPHVLYGTDGIGVILAARLRRVQRLHDGLEGGGNRGFIT